MMEEQKQTPYSNFMIPFQIKWWTISKAVDLTEIKQMAEP